MRQFFNFDCAPSGAPLEKEIAAARLESHPVSGDELQAIVDELMAMPKTVRERGRKLVE